MRINIVTAYDVALLSYNEFLIFKSDLIKLNGSGPNIESYEQRFDQGFQELVEDTLMVVSSRPQVEYILHYYAEQVAFPDPRKVGIVREVSIVKPGNETIDLAIEVLVQAGRYEN